MSEMNIETPLAVVDSGEYLLAAIHNVRGISVNSKKTYHFQVKSYLDFCKLREKPVGIETVRAWIEQAGTPKSAMTRLAAIKRTLREVFGDRPEWKNLQDDLKEIKTPKVSHAKRRDQYLTSKEIAELRKAMPYKEGLLVQALFETGLRVSELCRLRQSDCMPYTDRKTKERWIVLKNIVGKGGVEASAFLSVGTLAEIRKAWKGKVFLFEDKKDRALSRFYVTHTINEYSKKVFGRQLSAHNMRHSKAMYLKDELHLDIYQIQKALNHKKISTTGENYFHGTPDGATQGLARKKRERKKPK